MSEWHDASDHTGQATAGVLAVVVDREGYETFALAAWMPHAEKWQPLFVAEVYAGTHPDAYKVTRWRDLPVSEIRREFDVLSFFGCASSGNPPPKKDEP